MDLNGDVVIQKEEPVEVSFDYLPSCIKTRNIAVVSNEPIVEAFDYVINKMSCTPVHRGSQIPVIACIGEVGRVLSRSILWGCDVGVCAETVIPRVLTGPLFYSMPAYKDPGRYCDSRVLIPWAFDIKKERPDTNILMVTDSDLIKYSNELNNSGITVVSSSKSLRNKLQAIAKSRIVLADSLDDIILSEALGVRVFPFIRNMDNRLRLTNYYSGTGRSIEQVEFLDFSQRVVLTSFPPKTNVKHDIDFLLDNTPFRCEEETKLEIKEYYNEIQKYK